MNYPTKPGEYGHENKCVLNAFVQATQNVYDTAGAGDFAGMVSDNMVGNEAQEYLLSGTVECICDDAPASSFSMIGFEAECFACDRPARFAQDGENKCKTHLRLVRPQPVVSGTVIHYHQECQDCHVYGEHVPAAYVMVNGEHVCDTHFDIRMSA